MLVLIVFLFVTAVICYYLLSASSRYRGSLIERLQAGFSIRQNQLKCDSLRQELRKRLDADTADRLIISAKLRYPGKPEYWYLEKVLYDLKRGR